MRLLMAGMLAVAAFGLAAAVLGGAAVLGFLSQETRPAGRTMPPAGQAVAGH